MNNCPEHAAVKVLKFGGTSVGTFDAVSRTMDIVEIGRASCRERV